MTFPFIQLKKTVFDIRLGGYLVHDLVTHFVSYTTSYFVSVKYLFLMVKINVSYEFLLIHDRFIFEVYSEYFIYIYIK